MNVENIKRLAAVQALVDLSGSVNDVVQKLSDFVWDYDGPPIILRRHHIEGAINKYLSGELTDADIENWASSIEGRDDIKSDMHSEELIDAVVFELANPLLTQEFNATRAEELCQLLAQEQ